MSVITKPGVYDIPAAAYHSVDCTPAPALSAGAIHSLMEDCPARMQHERTDVARQAKNLDVGTAAHLMFLEPDQFHARVSIVDAKDWRTNAAKEARAAARADDLVPLLAGDVDEIEAMRAALQRHPIARKAFQDGLAERSYFWRDERCGIWGKARVDYEPHSLAYLVDYKTTGTSAHPRKLQRLAWDLGWFSRAAWYLDGVTRVTGTRPREYWYCVQETKAPYLVSVAKLRGSALEWGRIYNERAAELYAECLRANDWPGYRDPARGFYTAFELELPPFAEHQLHERDQAGEFRTAELRGVPKPNATALAAAMEFQRPLGD